MNKEEIKKKVIALIKDLESTLPDLKSAAQPVEPDNAIGRLSRMDAIGSQAINKQSYEKASSRIQNLKSVLNKIDQPDFGICIAVSYTHLTLPTIYSV